MLHHPGYNYIVVVLRITLAALTSEAPVARRPANRRAGAVASREADCYDIYVSIMHFSDISESLRTAVPGARNRPNRENTPFSARFSSPFPLASTLRHRPRSRSTAADE